MGAIASQITSLAIVYSIVCSDTDKRKHQSSASLAFVRGIHRGPVNSQHKWQVARKMFPYYDVIMLVKAATGDQAPYELIGMKYSCLLVVNLFCWKFSHFKFYLNPCLPVVFIFWTSNCLLRWVVTFFHPITVNHWSVQRKESVKLPIKTSTSDPQVVSQSAGILLRKYRVRRCVPNENSIQLVYAHFLVNLRL